MIRDGNLSDPSVNSSLQTWRPSNQNLNIFLIAILSTALSYQTDTIFLTLSLVSNLPAKQQLQTRQYCFSLKIAPYSTCLQTSTSPPDGCCLRLSYIYLTGTTHSSCSAPLTVAWCSRRHRCNSRLSDRKLLPMNV